MDRLVLDNINLVYHILQKLHLYNNCEYYFDIGLIGLVKASKTFETNKGYNFSTYASRCITNEILCDIRKEKTNSRKANHNCISIEQTIYADDGGSEISLLDTLKCKTNIEEEIILKEQIQLMYSAISHLTNKEKFVICHLYGIGNNNILRQERIAKVLGISQAQVSRIKNKAIDKIKMMVN